MITAAHCGIIFSRNISLTVLCMNVVRLKTIHTFFLHCNLSEQPGHDLFNRVSTFCQPTVNIFVYGRHDLSVNENAELLSGSIL